MRISDWSSDVCSSDLLDIDGRFVRQKVDIEDIPTHASVGMTGHDGGRHLDRGCCVRSSVACVGLIRFRTSGEKANKGNCQAKREQAARRRDAVGKTYIIQGKKYRTQESSVEKEG